MNSFKSHYTGRYAMSSLAEGQYIYFSYISVISNTFLLIVDRSLFQLQIFVCLNYWKQ